MVYIGCEGASEVGYAALLQDFVNDAGQAFYLKIDDLGRGAGDPLARVEMAVAHIEQLVTRRAAPQARFILLDDDQLILDARRAEQAVQLASRQRITLVWQSPASKPSSCDICRIEQAIDQQTVAARKKRSSGSGRTTGNRCFVRNFRGASISRQFAVPLPSNPRLQICSGRSV